MTSTERALDRWPPLAYAELKDTLHAVHMWTQVVGKIRLALTPLVNHWWNSTLYVTPRVLTTSLIPSGSEAFQIDFDFIAHELVIVTSRGAHPCRLPDRSRSSLRTVTSHGRSGANCVRSGR